MTKPSLHVVIGSTRPGRVGPKVATWFAEAARMHGHFEVEVVDLATLALPLYDEVEHPNLARYAHDHTKRWSAIVESADAIAFVIPEYNHSFNAATKNAIDFLHSEWRYKPVGFVSYGGVAAGTRAVQALKPVFTALKAVPLFESVNIPLIGTHLRDGRFDAPVRVEHAAEAMLTEMGRVTSAMQSLRTTPARLLV